jgi:hypothetical protein
MQDLGGFGSCRSKRRGLYIETYLSDFIRKRHKRVVEDMRGLPAEEGKPSAGGGGRYSDGNM